MAEETVKINLNLDALQKALTQHVHRISAFVEAARSATLDALHRPLHVKGQVMAFEYGPAPQWSDEQARLAFDSWVLSSGFRDLAEITTHFLGSVHSVAGMGALNRIQAASGHVTPAEWKSQVIDQETRFEKANLPDKLRLLTEDRDIKIPELAVTHLATLYRVRNCLVHRDGFVQEADLTTDSSLVARWLHLTPYAVWAGGEERLTFPYQTKAETRIDLRLELNTKEFPLRSRVLFDASEFNEIAHGFALFGQLVVAALQAALIEAGIVPAPPPAST